MKILIGVDPGVTGAIAYEIEGCTTAVPWNDVSDMYYLLKGVLSQVPSSDEPVAYLEHVTASPIMGKKACFTFGHNFGQWETLLFCLKIRTELVKPQTWQRSIPGLTGTGAVRKKALKNHAARLFPGERVTAATQDALLILNYAKHHGR